MSEEFARPSGCLSVADLSSRAAERIAPADSTTMSAVNTCGEPSRGVTATPVTERPLASVMRRSTVVLVIRVRFAG